MKKTLLFLLLFLLLSKAGFAQDSSQISKKQYIPNFKVGVFVSPEWSADYFSFTHFVDAKIRTGYNFGLVGFKSINKRLSLRIGLGYSKKSYMTTDYEYIYPIRDENGLLIGQGTGTSLEDFRIHDIIVPINFYWDYGQYNKSPLFYFFSAGTELGFLVRHTMYFKYTPQVTPNKKGRQSATSIPQRVQLNIGMGVGYDLKNGNALRLEPNVKADLVDIFKKDVPWGNPTFSYGIRFMFTHTIR